MSDSRIKDVSREKAAELAFLFLFSGAEKKDFCSVQKTVKAAK